MAYETRINVSVTARVNLGNYESADVHLGLSGIVPGTSAVEIEHMLETGDVAFSVLRESVKEKIENLRASHDRMLKELGGG